MKKIFIPVFIFIVLMLFVFTKTSSQTVWAKQVNIIDVWDKNNIQILNGEKSSLKMLLFIPKTLQ